MTTTLINSDLDDQRTIGISPLVSPAQLRAEHRPDDAAVGTVRAGRKATVDILDGIDDRLMVVVGPCSVHDPDAAREYAARLAGRAGDLADRLHVVMRVYFEKPRTSLGWKGLLNDPHLDGSFDVNTGLSLGRQLLVDISGLGLPVACEFLDPDHPAVPCRHGQLRRDRCPHRRQPGAPPTLQRALDAGGYQERHRR